MDVLLHPSELWAIVSYKLFNGDRGLDKSVSNRQDEKEIHSTDSRTQCYHFLNTTSRSFAAVVQALDMELRDVVSSTFIYIEGNEGCGLDLSVLFDSAWIGYDRFVFSSKILLELKEGLYRCIAINFIVHYVGTLPDDFYNVLFPIRPNLIPNFLSVCLMIEDDMTIPTEEKVPLLKTFHLKLYEKGWQFHGSMLKFPPPPHRVHSSFFSCVDHEKEKDRILLQHFNVVIEEFARLKPVYALLSLGLILILFKFCKGINMFSKIFVNKWATEWPSFRNTKRLGPSRIGICIVITWRDSWVLVCVGCLRAVVLRVSSSSLYHEMNIFG